MPSPQHLEGAVVHSGGGLLRGPATYQARSPWGPGMAVLATALILVFSFSLAFILTVDNVQLRLLILGRADFETGTGLRLMVVAQILIVLLTVLAGTLFRGRVLDVLALRRVPGGWWTYAGAILAMAGLQIVLTAAQMSLLRHDVLIDMRGFVALTRGPYWPLAAAMIGVGAPLSEELLFRGFLLSALAATRLGFWGAAIVTSALWTTLHYGYSAVGIAEVFIVGLFLSWLLWRTGSLRVAIFCHALFNSLQFAGLRFIDLPT